jgi:hypothetical protein
MATLYMLQIDNLLLEYKFDTVRLYLFKLICDDIMCLPRFSTVII